MPGPANLLPVYAAGDALLGYVTPAAAQRMLDAGRAIGRGTKHTVRALIAVHDNIDLVEPEKPCRLNDRYSFKGETDDNPKGVWTFKKLSWQKLA